MRYVSGDKFTSRQEFFEAIDRLETVWDENAGRAQNAHFLIAWPYRVLRDGWKGRFRKAVRLEESVSAAQLDIRDRFGG